MAKWKYRIDVKDAWKQAKNGEITIQELAAIVVGQLKALEPYNRQSDPDLIDVVNEFESLAEDKNAGRDDFDVVWEQLYDWGDITLDQRWPREKMCWIATV
jgi:putative heme iron utilization protein